jgi:hypothetical protein
MSKQGAERLTAQNMALCLWQTKKDLSAIYNLFLIFIFQQNGCFMIYDHENAYGF